MKVLVIIVSYNFERWIDRCLNSLRHSEYPIDVLVIDNGSKDQTIQRIKNDFPEIRLIESPENLGFGKANNIGMKIALEEGYQYVFLMNQDAWIEPGTIGTLVSLSSKHPEYGILSPVHLTGKGDRPDPGFGHYAKALDINHLPHDEITEISFVNAAFWLIPSHVLKKAGGFCPLFYHYGEDKDFINRLHFHRLSAGYSPKVFGNHDREYRPVTHEGFLRSEYVYHLAEYANINYPWLKAFGYGILATIKKSFLALLKGKVSLSKEYVHMTTQLLSRSKEINNYRRINRLPHPHYIS